MSVTAYLHSAALTMAVGNRDIAFSCYIRH